MPLPRKWQGFARGRQGDNVDVGTSWDLRGDLRGHGGRRKERTFHLHTVQAAHSGSGHGGRSTSWSWFHCILVTAFWLAGGGGWAHSQRHFVVCSTQKHFWATAVRKLCCPWTHVFGQRPKSITPAQGPEQGRFSPGVISPRQTKKEWSTAILSTGQHTPVSPKGRFAAHQFSATFHRAVQAIGGAAEWFAAHSFRIRTASTAVAVGVSPTDICAIGKSQGHSKTTLDHFLKLPTAK